MTIWPTRSLDFFWVIDHPLDIWSNYQTIRFLPSCWSAAASVVSTAGQSSQNGRAPGSESWKLNMEMKIDQTWNLPQSLLITEITTMIMVIAILMPTVESRSHWTIAMQVSRSPFKISENLRRLFTHLTTDGLTWRNRHHHHQCTCKGSPQWASGFSWWTWGKPYKAQLQLHCTLSVSQTCAPLT